MRALDLELVWFAIMNERLSNLNAKLRVQMRAEISCIQRQLSVTTVYVTHDQVEAMTMGAALRSLGACVAPLCQARREGRRVFQNLPPARRSCFV